MTPMKTLLFELGTEELPPKSLPALGTALADHLATGLRASDLSFTGIQALYGPRRLALLVHDLADRQPDRMQQRRGPAVQAAFDDQGQPTRAAQGFARSCGVAVTELDRLENDKGAWLVYREHQPGKSLTALLPDLLQQALKRLPVVRRMRWGASDFSFVRPVHWCICLYGDAVIDLSLYGLNSGRISYGHRIHAPDPITLQQADDYAAVLEEAKVLVDPVVRRRRVIEQVQALLPDTLHARLDANLVDEVSSMLEWPQALLGSFDADFLQLPEEALVAEMQQHQKYFPVLNKESGRLQAQFVALANVVSSHPALVQQGNERVLGARLSDAAFFWQQDKKTALADLVPLLDKVVFQTGLGSMGDKTRRVQRLMALWADRLQLDVQLAEQAASLCKADLLTHMVGEFPELQGTMGRYYALDNGYAEPLADALEQAYWPRQAKDGLPQSTLAQALALADRLDTLAGIFATGQRPTGDKDPLALRRSALAVVRILIEKQLDLDLRHLLDDALSVQPVAVAEDIRDTLFDFIMDRLRAYYQEQGMPADAFAAVLVCQPGKPWDFDRRMQALGVFSQLPGAAALAAANKRIHNLLRQAEEKGYAIAEDSTCAVEVGAEADLAAAIQRVERALEIPLQQYDYEQVVHALASLQEPVDTFFDQAMIMVDDVPRRTVRLGLLLRIQNLVYGVADLSQLQLEHS